MNTSQRVIRFIQEHMALLCFSCLLAGLLAGGFAEGMAFAIPWLFGILTFNSGLGLRVQDLSCIRAKPWVLLLLLVWLHIAAPLVVMTATSLLGFHVDAVMGFAILSMLPVSASTIVWVGFYRGNVTLAMTLLLVDTVLSPFLIPYVLDFLFGATVHMHPFRMLRGLFWMLLFPTLLALALNRITNGTLQRVAGSAFSIFARLAIFTILFINGGVIAPFFQDFDPVFFAVIPVSGMLYALWFLSNFFLGLAIFKNREDTIGFMTACSVRSVTAGMVIAMTYFAPLTTVTVVTGMLFQPPLASLSGKLASGYFERRESRSGTDP